MIPPKEAFTARVFTADDLIAVFGDQAYHKGVRMAVEALRGGDPESSRALCQANIELIRRGYDKKAEVLNG